MPKAFTSLPLGLKNVACYDQMDLASIEKGLQEGRSLHYRGRLAGDRGLCGPDGDNLQMEERVTGHAAQKASGDPEQSGSGVSLEHL